MKVIGIIENNHVTGIVYGEVEVNEPVTDAQNKNAHIAHERASRNARKVAITRYKQFRQKNK